MRFKKYVFICTNERAEGHPRGSCATNGSLAVLEEFKLQLKEKKLNLEVRANKTGCMECCEIGPAVMIHPDNVWYQNVKPEDVGEIIEQHIVGGKPVERLKADFTRYKKLLGF
jgi:(2Fe-2S) ferredoxin